MAYTAGLDSNSCPGQKDLNHCQHGLTTRRLQKKGEILHLGAEGKWEGCCYVYLLFTTRPVTEATRQPNVLKTSLTGSHSHNWQSSKLKGDFSLPVIISSSVRELPRSRNMAILHTVTQNQVILSSFPQIWTTCSSPVANPSNMFGVRVIKV